MLKLAVKGSMGVQRKADLADKELGGGTPQFLADLWVIVAQLYMNSYTLYCIPEIEGISYQQNVDIAVIYVKRSFKYNIKLRRFFPLKIFYVLPYAMHL